MDYKFTLSTDSTCDLYASEYAENDIKHVSLTFMVEKDGKIEDRLDEFTEYRQYVDFYNELRAGAFSRTAMLNYEAHYTHFLKLAKEGAEDVVHFTISSGLSPTKDVAAKAAADVKADYPKFNVYVVDPLTATVGQGALVKIALRCRNEGKTAEETYALCNSSWRTTLNISSAEVGSRRRRRCSAACSTSSPSSPSTSRGSSSRSRR